MVLYDLAGNNWNRYPVYAPGFKSNTYFYTIINNVIFAVIIKDSYLKFVDSEKLNLYGKFETPHKDTIVDNNGYLWFKDENHILYLHIDNLDYPVYDTVTDAKNNIKSKNVIDISKYSIVNNGYSYGQISRFGCNYVVDAYYWVYYTVSLVPCKKNITANSIIWSGDNLLLAQDGIQIPDKTWASEEAVLSYLRNKNKNLEVVSFKANKSKPEIKTFNINIEVNINMSLEEIR